MLGAFNRWVSLVSAASPTSIRLLSVQGLWITGLGSPLSVFSTYCIIKLFSAKYSNLFHVRCLAVLETQEPLGELKAQEDRVI